MAIEQEYSLENRFIDNLVKLGYEKVTISDENELYENLKQQLEKHNNTIFSEQEFSRILIFLKTSSVFSASKKT